MEVFNLDLIPGRSNPVIHCSQFDEGRTFRANLFEGSSVYTLTGAETLTLIEKKLDGNMVTISVTNTSDSYVEFATTQQMTALEGEQLCELRIENGGNLIGTLNFLLDCEPSPDTGIASDSAIHNLEAQIAADVAIEVANQYDSNNVLFDTAPTSGHGVPYAVTSGGLWSWLRDLPLRAYPTASGSIATFDTSLALPLQDCTIAINAVQESGTPTPSSPKLISGFTGANIHVVGSNLTDEQWELGMIDGTTGANTPGTTSLRTTNYIPIEPNTTYYFYIGGTGTGSTNPYLYDQNKQYIGRLGSYLRNQTFTTPSNAYYIRLGLQAGYGTTYNNNISINYPATDTAYHAYNANSTTTAISWNDEAGTVYGGSLDVTSGVLTVTHGYIDLGSLSWDYTAQGYGRSSTAITNPKLPASESTTANIICECLVANSANQVYSHNEGIAVDSASRVRVYWSTMPTTSSDIKTALSGQLLVYELATPQTYQLTPTQISAIVGTNNIFTDTNGNTSVVYACSLKDYIDSQ